MRLTYKSPHGGYGYNADVDFYSNQTKGYIGRLEDIAEMGIVYVKKTDIDYSAIQHLCAIGHIAIEQAVDVDEKIIRLETYAGCSIEHITEAFASGFLCLDMVRYEAWEKMRVPEDSLQELVQKLSQGVLEGEERN